MRWAMVLFSFLCIALGVWPEPLYRMLPYAVQFEAYTAAHVLTQLQLLLFSGLAFFVMLGFLKRTPTITLDFDWIWRVLLPALARRVGALISAAQAFLVRVLSGAVQRLSIGVARQRAPQGLLVRTWPTRSMAVWVMVMLLVYLVLYYVR